jgi:hypothetical protein
MVSYSGYEQLTPWSLVDLEKQTVNERVEKFFSGIHRPIITFARAQY